mgnify:CR=1 FL=1
MTRPYALSREWIRAVIEGRSEQWMEPLVRVELRRHAGVRVGLGTKPDTIGLQTPRIALVSAPVAFRSLDGERYSPEHHDIGTRMISMQRAHKAIPGTGGLNLGVATQIAGTIPNRFSRPANAAGEVRVANPSGLVSVGAVVRKVAARIASRLPGGQDASSGTPLPAKARHVIHIFAGGAPSHLDTLDPKPALEKYRDQSLPGQSGVGFPSPFKFPKCGRSGLEISEIFPRLGTVADELCVVRSVVGETPLHGAQDRGGQRPVGVHGALGCTRRTAGEHQPGRVLGCRGGPVVRRMPQCALPIRAVDGDHRLRARAVPGRIGLEAREVENGQFRNEAREFLRLGANQKRPNEKRMPSFFGVHARSQAVRPIGAGQQILSEERLVRRVRNEVVQQHLKPVLRHLTVAVPPNRVARHIVEDDIFVFRTASRMEASFSA